jgi:hypothetical protein
MHGTSTICIEMVKEHDTTATPPMKLSGMEQWNGIVEWNTGMAMTSKSH